MANFSDTIPAAPASKTNVTWQSDGSNISASVPALPTLATVATTGAYSDLTGKPTIPAAQVNSDWNAASGLAQILNKPTIPAAQVQSDWTAVSGVASILNKPTLATVATSGLYSDLLSKPTLATVATSGLYSDLLSKPTIPAAQVNSDWNAISGLPQILNKPTLATVATSGLYSDLTGKPTIPAAQVQSDWNAASGLAQILNKPTIPAAQVQSDWTAVSGVASILHKPTLATVATSGLYSDLLSKPTLATVATSGLYSDLLSKPTIPAAQVNSDWNAISGLPQILNKPTLATVATSGLYSDLTGKPTIPAAQVQSDWNAASGLGVVLNKPTLGTAAAKNITDFDAAGAASSAVAAIPVATSLVNGLLSKTDWATFNAKQSALTFGALTEATSSVLTITGGAGAVIGSGTSITVKQASSIQSGFLSNTDWTAFNGKLGSIAVTNDLNVTGSVAGGTITLGWTGQLSIARGGTGSATQQTAINALTGTQSAGKYLRSDGTNAALAAIVAGDVPTLNQSTTGNAATATTAANMSGGVLGSLGYQSGAGVSAMLAPNLAASDMVLVSHGTGTVGAAPTWSNAPALSAANMSSFPASASSGLLTSSNTWSGANTFTSLVRFTGALITTGSVKAGSTNPVVAFSTTDATNPFQLVLKTYSNSAWAFSAVEQGLGYKAISLNPDGGNILVGTSTDNTTDRLQVAGSLKVSTNATVTGTVTTGGLTFTAGSAITGPALTISNMLTLSGAVTSSNGLTVTGGLDLSNQAVTGDVGFGGNLTFANTCTFTDPSKIVLGSNWVTWTQPTINGITMGVSVSAWNGSYLRIGPLVIYQFTMNVTFSGTPSGYIDIPLPITGQALGTASIGASNGTGWAGANWNWYMCLNFMNPTYLRVYAGGGAAFNWSTGSSVTIQGTITQRI